MRNNVISLELDDQGRPLRRIRSFVRRQRRLTKGQQHALDTLWPAMGTDYQAHPLDLDALFSRAAPVTLEIGFGMGVSLVTMASAHPEQNFIGIEVYLPGVGACLASAQEAGVSNLRVICHNAVEVLEKMIQDASLALVQLFFPDPWHKERHNKRRIIQASFVELVSRKLAAGGVFHMATDWQPYAEHMLAVMSAANSFHNLSFTGDCVPRPASRPLTKFEQRGQKLGHRIWDLMFEKET
ncbi:tRNA (guanine-N7)-methyltransferase [Sodalis-like endosymbiont of Proechinophthirus fluctus]|uniref:tRNA (guanosine(46)-N7)-methyltransferase TrmB n=1 Tax=Sodalis-like endosymbiont of Proechinophthirus fluctus TaxID=1462730 RepID=UPI0007A8F8AE|nr:tRNA (guanosine(46)-N7)-methyltransferase TrmB [Sodalis-like endosymbiont of Proechinophthirus fluctus]KYP97119.1 tRNA (guanine-N7)-methyltransferase [Sodalis-like endosymbiont of Proechinophthirus fluctus]